MMKRKLIPALMLILVFSAGCATTGNKAVLTSLDEIEARLDRQSETLTRLEQDMQKTAGTGSQTETLSDTSAGPEEVPASESGSGTAVPPVSVVYELDGKVVLGQTETVYIAPPGEHYKARIDTGATSSSLHAADITEFERDGKTWVRFNLTHMEDERAVIIEQPIVDYVRIRQASSREVVERPVVRLFIALGGIEMETEFSLADRSRMSYPVLIGRNVLMDMAVVDVSLEYAHEPYNGEDH